MITKITQFFELLDKYNIRLIKRPNGIIRTQQGYCPLCIVAANKKKFWGVKDDDKWAAYKLDMEYALSTRIVTAADNPGEERHIRYQLLKRCR